MVTPLPATPRRAFDATVAGARAIDNVEADRLHHLYTIMGVPAGDETIRFYAEEWNVTTAQGFLRLTHRAIFALKFRKKNAGGAFTGGSIEVPFHIKEALHAIKCYRIAMADEPIVYANLQDVATIEEDSLAAHVEQHF